MSYIEGLARENGEIRDEALDLQTLVATRSFLTAERIRPGRRRRGSRMKPEVISTDETDYVVDGHHKVRRACDSGATSIDCRVLHTSNPRIAQQLERRNHGLVSRLPFR